MKNDKIKYLLCLLFFTVLATITFRCVWPADHVFSASDLNIGRLAYIKSLLPEIFVGYFRGTELLGISSHGISLFNILLSAMPLVLFANVFYGIMLVLGSVSMVWFLRMWNRSWFAAVFGALIAFWVNSILLAHVGHAYKMEVLVFSVLALCLIEKSIVAETLRTSIGFALLAGLAVSLMMIEQQDVALLAGLFIGSYTIFRLLCHSGKVFRQWVAVLLPIGVVALLLSGNTVLKSYERNIAGAASVQTDPEEKWNFITQWSAVPQEWPDLIALGWGGWSTGNSEGPYWGKLGRSAEWETTGQGFRNFKLNSVYFGIIPFLMGAFGFAMALRNRKTEEGRAILFWSIAGLIGFWLAFGKYSLLYKLFYHLPLFGDIRAPIKLLDNVQICMAIVAAYGLDQLIDLGKRSKPAKLLWIIGSVFAGLMLLAGLRIMVFPSGWHDKFTDMGYAQYADILVQGMSHAWIHAGLMTLLTALLALLVWKGWRHAKWIAAGFVLLMVVDSLILTSRHFEATNIKSMRKGNPVINYLKENQGNERTFFVDQSGIYNQWLASDGPYHGLNLFNVWQMSRMPVEYKEFLGTVGRNQIRLWELASIRYVAAPASITQQLSQNPALGKQFKTLLTYQVPTAQGMRNDVLLQFMNSIPRFALFQGWKSMPLENQCRTLASPGHKARATALLDVASGLGDQPGTTLFQPLDAKVTKRSAAMTVKCGSPSIVRFSQYYQPGWQVFVNGKAAKLLRVDYLCMGVAVPPGEHEVEFRCASGAPKAFFALGVLVVSLAGALWLIRSMQKGDE